MPSAIARFAEEFGERHMECAYYFDFCRKRQIVDVSREWPNSRSPRVPACRDGLNADGHATGNRFEQTPVDEKHGLLYIAE